MKFSKENWEKCLETLQFYEQENCSFGGMVVFNDNDVPCWTYTTEEEKERLYIFLSGAVYWKIHTKFNNRKEV